MKCTRWRARCWLGLLSLVMMFNSSRGGVNIVPKFMFLDASRRSFPFSVVNNGTTSVEGWIEVKFGYECSDDTGGFFIKLDSLAVGEPSAAGWVRAYPHRFVLDPGETQTVRLTVSAPDTISDGEYWARIFVTTKDRNPPKPARDTTGSPQFRNALDLYTQISCPFHYRKGKVSTGLEVNEITASVKDTTLEIRTSLTRTGNAAFWGARTIQFVSSSGKSVYTFTKNLGVYKTLTLIDRIKRSLIPPGSYTVDIECVTGKRSDLNVRDLVHALPVRASTSVVVP